MPTVGSGPLRDVALGLIRNPPLAGAPPSTPRPRPTPEEVVATMPTVGDGPLRDVALNLIRQPPAEAAPSTHRAGAAEDANHRFVTVPHGPLRDVLRRAMMIARSDSSEDSGDSESEESSTESCTSSTSSAFDPDDSDYDYFSDHSDDAGGGDAPTLDLRALRAGRYYNFSSGRYRIPNYEALKVRPRPRSAPTGATRLSTAIAGVDRACD